MAGMSDVTQCDQHGEAFQTFICRHLAENPSQTWHSTAPNAENKWPDAWCSVCHVAYLRENQWNEKNEEEIEARLFCHKCYEACRALGECIDFPDYEIPD
jgi:hypothetical protein